jgi:hypothetical protein
MEMTSSAMTPIVILVQTHVEQNRRFVAPSFSSNVVWRRGWRKKKAGLPFIWKSSSDVAAISLRER